MGFFQGADLAPALASLPLATPKSSRFHRSQGRSSPRNDDERSVSPVDTAWIVRAASSLPEPGEPVPRIAAHSSVQHARWFDGAD